MHMWMQECVHLSGCCVQGVGEGQPESGAPVDSSAPCRSGFVSVCECNCNGVYRQPCADTLPPIPTLSSLLKPANR